MATVRQLGQFHADLCAVEFRTHVVSWSSATLAKTRNATVEALSMPLLPMMLHVLRAVAFFIILLR
jgi:hypothetical protein